MDFGNEILHMRVALIWGKQFCKDRPRYKCEEDALDALEEHPKKEQLTPWPCPYCKGNNITLPDGHKSSLRSHGWHLGPVMPIQELVEIAEMTAEECEKYGYPIGNEQLKEHIKIFENEELFEQYNPEQLADPKIRRAYRAAEQSYFVLKDLLGVK